MWNWSLWVKNKYFECTNWTNYVELEHQSGFYNVNVLEKWIVILYGSVIFEPLQIIQ